MTKYIINADDFGLDMSCTKAIIEAMERGLITDTTMVANGEKQAYCLAVEVATTSVGFRNRVGIHFNLTEGEPLTQEICSCSAFVKNGLFHGKINRLRPLSKKERQAVYKELSAQIEKIKASGIAISHADSHHHIHTAIFVAPLVFKVCGENGIDKLRLHRNICVNSVIKKIVKYIYNQTLMKKFQSTEYFGSAEDMAKTFPLGLTEIMVHPDYNSKGELVDRIDVENGAPVGDALESAVGAFTKELSYYEAI